MDKQELIDALEQLQMELVKSDTVDSETLDRLQAITAELEAHEELSESVPPAPSDDDTHPLRDMLRQFETEHPQLSETLGRIADGLAQLGI